jgi:phosphomannomutase
MMGNSPPLHVFREYDVRGLAQKELSPASYELFGKAFGTLLAKRNGGKRPSCAVGRDNRASSPSYERAFVKGLRSTGCDVVRIGQVTTPMAYFANEFLHTTGAASVTASHNPPQYNGLKMRFKMLPVSGLDLKDYVVSGKFATGSGKASSKNIFSNYLKAVSSGNKLRGKFKVVVDCGNGTAGPFVVPALRAIGASVTALFCKPDPRFPNHSPNPVKPENFPWLIAQVRKQKADLGLMLDGDGDRVAAVDANGNIIWPDMLLLLFARREVAVRKGAKIVVEIKCSQSVIDDVRSRGGKPILSRTGYTNVEKLMAKEGARVGAEMSGHFYFMEKRAWLSDAIYASNRLCKLVSDSGKSIKDLISDAPKYYSSQEYRLHVTGEGAETRKAEIVAELTRAFKKTNRVIDIDGARVLFSDGWGLVRFSKNEPELSLRFEGKTPAALKRIQGVFRRALLRYKEVKAGF